MDKSVIPIVAFALLIALGEVVAPARDAVRRRWTINIALGVANAVLLRLLAVAGPFAAAGWAQASGIGLFNQVTQPEPLAWIATIIAMDFAIY